METFNSDPLLIDGLADATRTEWISLASQNASANAELKPCRANTSLDAAARREPQSPVAPAYRLWVADNLAREARYAEAVRAFDDTITCAESARRLLPHVDPICCSLLHKAQAAAIGGDTPLAIATYAELAKWAPSDARGYFEAGRLAERSGDCAQAADCYRAVRSQQPSPRADDPAELARRALLRLEDPDAVYLPNAMVLADALGRALESHDTAWLERSICRTHFAVGPLGGERRFEDLALFEHLLRELRDSTVHAHHPLAGSGEKRYLLTSGWSGEWFRGDVVFLLTRAPRGWQWTGVAISQAHDLWIERWRPPVRAKNQPLPFELLAPWPKGLSFMAGGLTDFGVKQAAVVAAGPIAGAVLAAGFSTATCGFGLRGFYYNQGSTHDEQDAFAIDFSRYRRFAPYVNESGGTRVLAVRSGIVESVSPGRESGDSEASNTVEIVHADPDNPADTERFRSRYLHLAGPFLIPVSEMMPVITGQRLGLMDDTGTSVIDHLHFSIHDRNIAQPGSSFGGSVRPTPMSGVRLGDGDDATCVESTNAERVPGLNFSPTVVSFGAVPVEQTRNRTLTIENTTGIAVAISIAASTTGPFRWPAVDRTIAHEDKTTLTAKFTPVNPGQTEKRITVNSNAPGNPHSVRLTGRGIDEDL